jgi:hypothetical protein
MEAVERFTPPQIQDPLGLKRQRPEHQLAGMPLQLLKMEAL